MNNIELAQKYLPLLDKLYQQESKTAIFEGDETTVQKDGSGEIKIAKIDMDGLGDFDRNDGYTKGSTTFLWETVKYDKERSEQFKIDRLVNREALGVPFGKLSGEFMRTKVIPETDAARIAKICGTEGISTMEETLTTGEQVITALRGCMNTMDNDEVPEENRILLINPIYYGLAEDLDTTKSKKVLERFKKIIQVPATRLWSAITLNDGKTNYGFTKAEGAKPVNFLCVEKSAVVCAIEQYLKYFSPDEDQDGDNHKFLYRNNNLYGHCYENKLAGIYASFGG